METLVDQKHYHHQHKIKYLHKETINFIAHIYFEEYISSFLSNHNFIKIIKNSPQSKTLILTGNIWMYFFAEFKKKKKTYIKMQKMSNYYLLLFLHAFVLFLALKIKKINI